MEFINSIEQTVAGWMKSLPRLPEVARTWLAQNIWWIVVIGAVLSGLGILGNVLTIFGGAFLISFLSPAFGAVALIAGLVSIGFGLLQVILLSLAIVPLQNRQEKGWKLLFITWLVAVVDMVVSAIVSFNPVTFIGTLLLGGIILGVFGYLLFEIRDHFMKVVKTQDAKAKR